MRIDSVIVTYEPDSISDLLAHLAPQCRTTYVVDNGSSPARLDGLEAECRKHGAQLIRLPRNTGIAHAQNVGILRALAHGAEAVLLSDQDSVPPEGMVDDLARVLLEETSAAAVGPLPSERRPGGDELVYVDRGWGPRRANAAELASEHLEAAFLLASGCLIRAGAVADVGLMREDLFIDHVDLEWGVRARRQGWRLLAVPAVRLSHTLGDQTVRLPGRTQPVHVHAPVRNYYLARNTAALIREDVLPWRWRVGYCVWLAKYVAFNSLLAGESRRRRTMLTAGLRDAMRGRMGPISR